MLSVSIRRLIESIEDATDFRLPEISPGTEYLLNDIYKPLTRNEGLKLSNIDFDAFDYDDVDEIRTLHNNVFSENEYKANGLTNTLQGITPAQGIGGFV